MRTAMLAFAGTMAFAFTIGSVSAADQFTTLKGVKAVQMSSGELSTVKGMDHHFFVDGVRHDTDQHQDDLAGMGNPPLNAKLIDFPQFNPDGTPMLDPVTGLQVVTTRMAAPSYNGLKHACANSLTNGGSITGPNFLC